MKPNDSNVGIKICGLQEEAGVKAAASAGATHIGFVFADSRRKVTPEEAARLSEHAQGLERVGVFVDPSLADLKIAIETVPLTVVQLHGTESKAFCEQVKTMFPSVKVWKAFAVKSSEIIPMIEEYVDGIDGILVDSYHPAERGGSGTAFSWDLLPQIKETIRRRSPSVPLWAAGGLTPENVSMLVSKYDIDGVDVSSGVEVDRKKSPARIREFINEVRKSNVLPR